MRLELKGSSIEVCLIEPGPIKSKFIQNGLPHFIDNTDQTNSVHAKQYKKQLQRLQTSGGKNRLRLGPEAVYSKLVHALSDKQPKAHYLVTLPTYMMAIARRILPYSVLEKVLSRSG